MMDEALINRFPKTRPALPTAQAAIYEQEYLLNREGRSWMSALSKRLESWMHREVNKHLVGNRILEIGAGTLNHIPYLNHLPLACYDVVEPAQFLYDSSQHKDRVTHFFSDIHQCTDQYSSIISIATLEHLTHLPDVLSQAATLLLPGGVCVHAVPCEGGALWGASWRISTGLAYRLRTGFSYTTLMRHEHVNHFDEIVALHHHFFDSVTIRYFPLFGKHCSLYACIIAKQPTLK